MVRPVADEFEVSQEFGSFPTAGVSPNANGSTVQRLVFQYGNYQPYGHAGQDIACPVGTPVHAIADGVVVWADWGTNLPGDDTDAGYRQRWYLYKSFPGIVTVIQHDGWLSVYGHLSSNDAAPRGTVVKAGQLIGYSGNTGGVAPHLHVAAIVDTSYRTGGGLIYGCADPAPYYTTASLAYAGESVKKAGFLMALSDADQDEVLAHERNNSDKLDVLIQRTATLEELVANVRKLVYALGSLPAATLNQPFQLPDGTTTNLAGILTAIHATPGVTTAAGGTDPQEVVKALAAQLAK